VDKLQDRGFEEVCELGRHIKECREKKGLSKKEVNEMFNSVAICNHWEAQDRNNALPPTIEHWNRLKEIIGCDGKFDYIVERIGKEREVIGLQKNAMSGWNMDGTTQFEDRDITKGNSEWEGFGTALKPAHEPIILARKPLSEKTIVENVLKHGTGAIDIDGTRIPTSENEEDSGAMFYKNRDLSMPENKQNYFNGKEGIVKTKPIQGGRFPANVVCTDDALNDGVMTKSQRGNIKGGFGVAPNSIGANSKQGGSLIESVRGHNDSGSKSRYFDIDCWAEKHGLLQFPKASKRERNEGCEGLEKKTASECCEGRKEGSAGLNNPRAGAGRTSGSKNFHPTVKPVHLMAWLVRLVTPPNGTCLDPFMGSGTTGVACKNLNRNFIGIELDPDYFKIAEKRIQG